MRTVSDARRGREVGIEPHDDGTVTLVVRTPCKAAAATIPLTDLLHALNQPED